MIIYCNCRRYPHEIAYAMSLLEHWESTGLSPIENAEWRRAALESASNGHVYHAILGGHGMTVEEHLAAFDMASGV